MTTTVIRVALSLATTAFGIYFLLNAGTLTELGLAIILLAIGGLNLVPRQ